MKQTPHARQDDRQKRMTRPAGHAVKALVISVALAAIAACNQGGGQQQAGAASQVPPALPVGVLKVTFTPVGISENLPGRVEASRVAEIRARAAGILEKRLFKEGSDVEAGQKLFQIDPAPLEAAVNSAQASLNRAITAEKLAAQKVTRYTPLIKANAVSRQDYDDAVAAQKQAAADIGVARAALRTAQINLSYATVTSPISGRIGRALVTEGALVGQGAATPLATVQQIDPVYVNITQPASAVMRLKAGLESGKLKHAEGGEGAAVRIQFDDGREYGEKGSLLFTDLTVNESTGQVTLRAEVPNPNGTLLPGMYVRALLDQAQIPEAVLIPQQAVTRTAQGDMVTLVEPAGTVEMPDPKTGQKQQVPAATRKQVPVQISGAQGTNWVVVGGLKAGDQVMVDGFQLVEMMRVPKVIAVPWQPGQPPVAQQPGAAGQQQGQQQQQGQDAQQQAQGADGHGDSK